MSTSGFDDIVYFRCSKSLITCQICMKKFESPILLPCQRTFCKKCIVSFTRNHCLNKDGCIKSESFFPCPDCRRQCKILVQIKGKQGIESQLECCFQENLPLKQILKSVEEKPSITKDKAWSFIDCEDQPRFVDKGKRNDVTHEMHISMSAAQVIEERLWFYYLFVSKLTLFLDSCDSSIRTSKRTSLITLYENLVRIPETIFNPTLQTNSINIPLKSMNIGDILRKIKLKEDDFSKSFSRLEQCKKMATQEIQRDVQTQTENSKQKKIGEIVCMLKNTVRMLFLILPVVWLLKCVYGV